jgi:hypothetical protein
MDGGERDAIGNRRELGSGAFIEVVHELRQRGAVHLAR